MFHFHVLRIIFSSISLTLRVSLIIRNAILGIIQYYTHALHTHSILPTTTLVIFEKEKTSEKAHTQKGCTSIETSICFEILMRFRWKSVAKIKNTKFGLSFQNCHSKIDEQKLSFNYHTSGITWRDVKRERNLWMVSHWHNASSIPVEPLKSYNGTETGATKRQKHERLLIFNQKSILCWRSRCFRI